MWKWITTILLVVWTAARWIIGQTGEIQTVQGISENRGKFVETAGMILTSQWFPLAALAVLLAVFLCLQLGWPPWRTTKQREEEDATYFKIVENYAGPEPLLPIRFL